MQIVPYRGFSTAVTRSSASQQCLTISSSGTVTSLRCQFHQHFTLAFFIHVWKCFKQLFSFQFGFVFFWPKNIGAKAGVKMLMKLTTDWGSSRLQGLRDSDPKRLKMEGPNFASNSFFARKRSDSGLWIGFKFLDYDKKFHVTYGNDIIRF